MVHVLQDELAEDRKRVEFKPLIMVELQTSTSSLKHKWWCRPNPIDSPRRTNRSVESAYGGDAYPLAISIVGTVPLVAHTTLIPLSSVVGEFYG